MFRVNGERGRRCRSSSSFFLLPFVTCLVILGVRMFLLRVSLNMLLRIVREGGAFYFLFNCFSSISESNCFPTPSKFRVGIMIGLLPAKDVIVVVYARM